MRAAFLVTVLVGLIAWTYFDYEAGKGFTPWMTGAGLQQFCDDHDTNPPGGHPNFWDQGHWIDAVQGRWHDGVPQYRLRYSASPKGKGGYYWWYWYFNQDQESFSRHVHEFADQGFTLLDPNSFWRPDQTRRYQGVWHKTQTKAEHDTEASHAKKAVSLPLTFNPLPPGSTPATPAFEVIDNGTKLGFPEINRDALGHDCSVYLKSGFTPAIPRVGVMPSGMCVTRGSVQIMNGQLFSITLHSLEIRNQNLMLPIMQQEIDYIVVAK